MPSKLDPESRYRGIGFRIGDVFPANDPIARWATVLAMAADNVIHLNVRLIEEELPPELELYYFRLVAAHFYEASEWLRETRKVWPELDDLIRSLDETTQVRYDRVAAFASQKHPLHARLRRSRDTLFHYPVMHPAREEAGVEELATAMLEASNLLSWIEGGADYASFRAVFADEVAVQFLGGDDEIAELMEAIREPIFELVRLAEAVLLVQLQRVPAEKTTIWRAGEPRPSLPLPSKKKNLPPR